ncbi:MAG: hypothetical protein IPJ13_01945 [Saprospiraceae bacterium]|nr:hypothetical protein [Saprospiraceae bacterium]
MAVLTLKPVDNKIVKNETGCSGPKKSIKGIGNLSGARKRKICSSKGFEKIELHARDTAVDFIKNQVYSRGKIFKEVGIDHLSMYKILTIILYFNLSNEWRILH